MWSYPLEFCLYPSKIKYICTVMYITFSLQIFCYMETNTEMPFTCNCTQKQGWKNMVMEGAVNGETVTICRRERRRLLRWKNENLDFSYNCIMHTMVKSNFFFKVAFSLGRVFLMCNTEMGFCHAMCIGVHIFFLSPIFAFTDSKRFKDNYSLRSVCATLCVPVLGKVRSLHFQGRASWCWREWL